MKRKALPVLVSTFGVFTVALVAAVALTSPVTAAPELGEAEAVACTSCHDKPGSKLLTDKGKYYEEMRSFAGYDEIISAFQRCTTCHDRKPGSSKLTRIGRKFAGTVGGMRELCDTMRPETERIHAEDQEQEAETDAPDGTDDPEGKTAPAARCADR